MTIASPSRYDTVFIQTALESAYGADPNGHRTRGSTRGLFYDIQDEERGVYFRGAHDLSGPGRQTPRHRHTFDQINVVLKGREIFAGENRTAGTFAYHPESVYYGPQETPAEGAEVIACQFPAPSGRYFGTFQVVSEAMAGLKAEKSVTFKDGMAIWPDGQVQDSIEACWEYLLNQKPLEYAPPRYDAPIVVHSQNMPWVPTKQRGIQAKHLGRFNECGPEAVLIKLDPGTQSAAGVAGCAQMRFVTQGTVTYGAQRCPSVSFFYYPPNVPFEGVTADQQGGAEVLIILLQPHAQVLEPLSAY